MANVHLDLIKCDDVRVAGIFQVSLKWLSSLLCYMSYSIEVHAFYGTLNETSVSYSSLNLGRLPERRKLIFQTRWDFIHPWKMPDSPLKKNGLFLLSLLNWFDNQIAFLFSSEEFYASISLRIFLERSKSITIIVNIW